MMKIALIFLLTMFCSYALESPLDQDMTDLDRKIDATFLSTGDNTDRSWITPSVNQKIIERLFQKRNEALKRHDISETNRYNRQLISLGHEATVKASIDSILVNGIGSGLYHAATEESLAPIMEAMLIADSVAKISGDGEIPVSPRKVLAIIAVRILRSRTSFPEETRKWADHMTASFSSEKNGGYFEYLCEWWEHNKEAVVARRYAEASWVPYDEGQLAYPGGRMDLAWTETIAASEAGAKKASRAAMPMEARIIWGYLTIGAAALLTVVWLILTQRDRSAG